MSEPYTTASVKVMRSHDYCHFEVCLSATLQPDQPAAAQVDDMRKTAARLADKAVDQYIVARENVSKLSDEARSRAYEVSQMERIEEKPEGQRTVDEQALLKSFKDAKWQASRRYDYEDDWGESDNEYDD